MRIYKAINRENGKVYIGQTIRPFEVRKAEHLYGHGGFYFGNALKKYDFDWEVLKECKSISELNKMEKHFIKKYKSNKKEFGYNLKSGGENSLASKRSRKKMSIAKQNMSDETKEKIRQTLLGRKHTPERIAKSTGWKHTEETKKKIGDFWSGRVVSKETREKMSKTRKVQYNTPKMHKTLSESAKRGWETRRQNA